MLLDLFERLAGVPAPVRGGINAPLNPSRERAAREIVAEYAGHSRPHIASAYLGGERRWRFDSEHVPALYIEIQGGPDQVGRGDVAPSDEAGTNGQNIPSG